MIKRFCCWCFLYIYFLILRKRFLRWKNVREVFVVSPIVWLSILFNITLSFYWLSLSLSLSLSIPLVNNAIQCRAIWYNAQVASSNEQYQKLGAVCIPYMMDDFPEGGIDYEFIRKTSKTGVFGFMRIVSAYILCRNPAWNSLTDLLGFLFGNRIKLRTRPIGGKFPGRYYCP